MSGPGSQAPPGFEARVRISPHQGRSELKNGLSRATISRSGPSTPALGRVRRSPHVSEETVSGAQPPDPTRPSASSPAPEGAGAVRGDSPREGGDEPPLRGTVDHSSPRRIFRTAADIVRADGASEAAHFRIRQAYPRSHQTRARWSAAP